MKKLGPLLLLGGFVSACGSAVGPTTGANFNFRYDSTLHATTIDIQGSASGGTTAIAKVELVLPVDLAPPGPRTFQATVAIDPSFDGHTIDLVVTANDGSGNSVGTGTAKVTVARGRLVDIDVAIMAGTSIPMNPDMNPQPMMPTPTPMNPNPMMPPPMAQAANVKEVEVIGAQTTASATFVDVPGATLSLTRASSAETWVLFASGVLASSDPGEVSAEVQISIDGVAVDAFGHQTRGTTENGAGFLSFVRVPPSAAPQTISAQFRAAAGTTTLDHLRLVAMRIPDGADFQYSEGNPLVERTGADLALQTLTFTPVRAGEYYVFAKTDQHERPSMNTAQAWLEDGFGHRHPYDDNGARFSNGRAAWQPMFTAMKSNLRGGSVTFTLRGTSSSTSDNPDWWDQSFAYRKKLTVTAGAQGMPAKYAVQVVLDHASLVNAFQALPDGTDVRIAKKTAAGWTEVDRVLDLDSKWNQGDTKIWFSADTAIAPNATDETYYLYYGHMLAGGPPSNAANIFTLIDGFDGAALDTTLWTVAAGTPRTANGNLVLGAGASLIAQAANAAGTDSIWEARVKMSDPAPDIVYWGASTAPSVATPDAIYYGTNASSVYRAIDSAMTSTLTIASPAQSHTYGFTREGLATIRWVMDGVEVSNHTPIAATQAALQAILINQSRGASATYDWVRVRSYVNPEPAVTAADPENLGGQDASQWSFRRLMAFRADAFDYARFVNATPMRTTTAPAFMGTNHADVPAPTAAADHVILQSQRIGGVGSDTGRKVGELRMDGHALLATSHKIDKDALPLDGYHHSAALAHSLHTAQAFALDNGVRSPDAISVSAADSIIVILRYPAGP